MAALRLRVELGLALAALLVIVAFSPLSWYVLAASVLLVLAWLIRVWLVVSDPGRLVAPARHERRISHRGYRSPQVAAFQRRRARAERAAGTDDGTAPGVRSDSDGEGRPRLTLVAELAGVLSLLVSVIALVKEFF